MIVKNDFRKFGKYLKNQRLRVKLKQREVARVLGYGSSQVISNFERGLCAPSLPALRKLIKLYGLEAEEIIERIIVDQREYLRKSLGTSRKKPSGLTLRNEGPSEVE